MMDNPLAQWNKLEDLNILVVENHNLVRYGLTLALQEKAVTNVHQAKNGKDALKQARLHQPDVILMDIMLPDGDGIQVIEALINQVPGVSIILLTFLLNEKKLMHAFSAGVKCICSKDIGVDRLLEMIHIVESGGTCLDPNITGKAFKSSPKLFAKSKGQTPLLV